MVRRHSSPALAERSGRLPPNDASDDGYDPWEGYEGLDLRPTILDSLLAWDVSRHARRDQERMRSAVLRIPPAAPRRY